MGLPSLALVGSVLGSGLDWLLYGSLPLPCHGLHPSGHRRQPTFNKDHKLNINTYIQQTPQTQHQNLHSTKTTNSTSKPTFNKHHKLNIKTYIQQTPQTQHQNLHSTNTTNSTSKPTFNKDHKLNIKTYIQQTPQTQHQNLHSTNTTSSTSKPTFNKHHKLNIKTYMQQTPQTQHQNDIIRTSESPHTLPSTSFSFICLDPAMRLVSYANLRFAICRPP